MKQKAYTLLLTLMTLAMFSSCNDEWTEELYEHYVSFKAPINSDGVSRINVRYKAGEPSVYELPLVVSGSTNNQKNLTVKIAIDPDTLEVLNEARFSNRTDLYYKLLPAQYYSFPETVEIKAGENTALLNISFNLGNLDLVEKWVLPITIEESSTGEYTPNYRKHYRKALLRVMPFNDYSGTYAGGALQNTLMNAGEGVDNPPLVKSDIVTYTVDDNTIFFYAGTVDETRKDRGLYKLKAQFFEGGRVELTCENGDREHMDFKLNKPYSFDISEETDAVLPYLKKRTIMIRNIDYEYTDYTMAPGARISYHVTGEMTIQRNINTQIPDEDQAIQWD